MTFATMTDSSTAPLPLRKGEPHGRALVCFAHGMGFILAWDGDEGVIETLNNEGINTGEGGSLETIDHETLPDGIYVGELDWVNEGPSDWPGGGDEYALSFVKARLATAEEWQHHLDGEWPWEPMRDEPVRDPNAV